jgi:serine protease Do
MARFQTSRAINKLSEILRLSILTYVFVSTLLIATFADAQPTASVEINGTLSTGARVSTAESTVGEKNNPLVARIGKYKALAERAKEYEKLNSIIKELVEICEPTVVHIVAQKSLEKNKGGPTRIEEAGAGVIIRHRGRMFVVTNRHVVIDAKLAAIRIQLSDGRFFRPTEMRTDRDSDLAVLYTNKKDLSPARLGDSEKIRIGDFVVAVGSPFGLNHSVSMGIISAKGRRDLDLGSAGVRLQDFLQTDAAINPGNSGGPLMNLRGEVIGINTAIASNSGHNEGIGFTIPVNMVMRIATELIDFGRVRRGFLGVSLDSKFTPEKAEALGLNTVYGARVTAITPGTPAISKVQVGDVILKYNGKTIHNDSHLVSEVSMTPIDRQVPITLYRKGELVNIHVTIRDRDQSSSKD